MAPALLSRLPPLDDRTGDLTVVIETPQGSPNKYDYDEGCAAFRLAGLLPRKQARKEAGAKADS